jgi:hypothetical protein
MTPFGLVCVCVCLCVYVCLYLCLGCYSLEKLVASIFIVKQENPTVSNLAPLQHVCVKIVLYDAGNKTKWRPVKEKLRKFC